jgi:hypothetical protein
MRSFASRKRERRPLNHDLDLTKILCKRNCRKVSKNLEVSWGTRILQIQALDRVNRLKGVRVETLETPAGDIFMEYKGEMLEFKEFNPNWVQPITLDSKAQISQRGFFLYQRRVAVVVRLDRS